MKKYYLACLVLLLPHLMQAQTSTCVSDTLLFRECFSGNIFRTDIRVMKAAYDFIDSPRKVKPSSPGRTYSFSDAHVSPLGAVVSPIELYGSEKAMFQPAQAEGFNIQIMDSMYANYISQHPKGENLDSVKADLVARLERFDTLATTKPLFYADIHGKYKGNIVRYVNDLYEKSMMGNLKRLEYFFHNPRKKLIQKDLGYQFSLSLALYEQWIAQVRNGEAEEE